MSRIAVPEPAGRLSADTYKELYEWMLENDQDAKQMVEWSTSQIGPPDTPEKMAYEVIWIILCAGRSAQSARTIEKKVLAAISAATPVFEAFGYRAKAEAIERAWRERESDFKNLQSVLAMGTVEKLVEWCGSLPYVGDDTMFQLAKNFGAHVPKPDIWLSRLAGFPDRPRVSVKFRFPACMALCRYLAEATGQSIALIDSVLWLACNKGVLQVDANAGPVAFVPRQISARSIMVPAG